MQRPDLEIPPYSDIEIPPYAAKQPARRGLDPAIRRMVIVAAAIAALLIAVTLIWTGIHPRFGPVPIIAPPSQPMRTAPANPGGLQVPGAQQQIMSGVAPSGPPKLAQGAELPDFAKLHAQVVAAGRKHPAKQAPAAPRAAAVMPRQRVAVKAAATVPSVPQDAALALPFPPAAPTRQPNATAAPATASTPSAQAPLNVASSAGPHAVQFAALTSRKDAMTAWHRLNARVPALFQGKTPVVVPGSVNGNMYYRLRVGGFATSGAARDFCAKAKAKGISCYVPR